MLRYIVLAILISVALGHAHKSTGPERRYKQRIQPVVEYDDDDYSEFDYSDYPKDSTASRDPRPWTISYWGNLLRNTRLPRLNITNPFTKLFTPYVIKIDFPPGTDPNLQPPRNPDRKKNPQPEYIYFNTAPNEAEHDTPQYIYDPVTQQYYEVIESSSQDYNPENNYYATTFKDQDEIVINLNDEHDEPLLIQTDESQASLDGVNQRELKESERYILSTYNAPADKQPKSKYLRQDKGRITRKRMQRRPLNWS